MYLSFSFFSNSSTVYTQAQRIAIILGDPYPNHTPELPNMLNERTMDIKNDIPLFGVIVEHSLKIWTLWTPRVWDVEIQKNHRMIF